MNIETESRYAHLSEGQIGGFIAKHEIAIAKDPYSANVDEFHLWMIADLETELERRSK